MIKINTIEAFKQVKEARALEKLLRGLAALSTARTFRINNIIHGAG